MRKKIIIILVILFGISSYVVLKTYLFHPFDVEVTCQTPTSFLVTWRTRIPTKARAYTKKSKQKLPIVDGLFSTKYKDERSQLAETSIYKNHSVVISDLNPDEMYYVRISNGLFDYSTGISAKTAKEVEEFYLPNPSWGQIVSGQERHPVPDSIVYFEIRSKVNNSKSTKISTVTSTDGTWTLDTGNVYDSSLSHLYVEKDSTVTISVRIPEGKRYSKEMDLNLTRPTGPLWLEKDLISETEIEESSEFISAVYAAAGTVTYDGKTCLCNKDSCGGNDSGCCDVLACASELVNRAECTDGIHWSIYGVNWHPWVDNYDLLYRTCTESWYLEPDTPEPTPPPPPPPPADSDCKSCDIETENKKQPKACTKLGGGKAMCMTSMEFNMKQAELGNMSYKDLGWTTKSGLCPGSKKCTGIGAPCEWVCRIPPEAEYCYNKENGKNTAYVEVIFIDGVVQEDEGRYVEIVYPFGTGPGYKDGKVAGIIEKGLDSKIFTILLANEAFDVKDGFIAVDVNVTGGVNKNPQGGERLNVCDDFLASDPLLFTFNLSNVTPPVETGPEATCKSDVAGYGQGVPACYHHPEDPDTPGLGGKCLNGNLFPDQISTGYVPVEGICSNNPESALGETCEWVCYSPKANTDPGNALIEELIFEYPGKFEYIYWPDNSGANPDKPWLYDKPTDMTKVKILLNYKNLEDNDITCFDNNHISPSSAVSAVARSISGSGSIDFELNYKDTRMVDVQFLGHNPSIVCEILDKHMTIEDIREFDITIDQSSVNIEPQMSINPSEGRGPLKVSVYADAAVPFDWVTKSVLDMGNGDIFEYNSMLPRPFEYTYSRVNLNTIYTVNLKLYVRDQKESISENVRVLGEGAHKEAAISTDLKNKLQECGFILIEGDNVFSDMRGSDYKGKKWTDADARQMLDEGCKLFVDKKAHLKARQLLGVVGLFKIDISQCNNWSSISLENDNQILLCEAHFNGGRKFLNLAIAHSYYGHLWEQKLGGSFENFKNALISSQSGSDGTKPWSTYATVFESQEAYTSFVDRYVYEYQKGYFCNDYTSDCVDRQHVNSWPDLCLYVRNEVFDKKLYVDCGEITEIGSAKILTSSIRGDTVSKSTQYSRDEIVSPVSASQENSVSSVTLLLRNTGTGFKYTTVTDNEGSFSIEVPGGKYLITATKHEYDTLKKELQLVSGKSYNIRIVLQSGETPVYGGAAEIEETAVRFEVSQGWNLIGLNVVLANEEYLASDFLKELSSQGILASRFMKFQDGNWKIYKFGDSKDKDFKLQLGEGYVLFASRDGVFEIKGKSPAELSPVTVKTGWNLISIPYSERNYTAQGLIDEASANGTSIDMVTRWDSKWVSFIMEDNLTYGYDFHIDSQKGYFIRSKNSKDLFSK
ncbi:MAG: carboxypeptidase regulatory-like domain-containing protein [Patescibacteria group bacterium]|nr:carboxypeptidase regulatory-like domain-containing protein [Patescibacteria group bacterium]